MSDCYRLFYVKLPCHCCTSVQIKQLPLPGIEAGRCLRHGAIVHYPRSLSTKYTIRSALSPVLDYEQNLDVIYF